MYNFRTIGYYICEITEALGFDILGWDYNGFHSFLCNSLHEELPEARFNEFTLMDNSFDDVEVFARKIRAWASLWSGFPVK